MSEAAIFASARKFLLQHRMDYEKAYADFRWPDLSYFNWAHDWFDVFAKDQAKTALWIVDEKGCEEKLSFQALSDRSSRVATFLRSHGIKPGDHILVMLPPMAPLWELMLAALKLGAVLIPTSMQASVSDLADRIKRGIVRFVVTVPAALERFTELSGSFKRCLVGKFPGWISYEDSYSSSASFACEPIGVNEPFLLYFTSGTTALPKLVVHTRYSYTVGHLSTMYWIGIRENDIHQNISSPGWAKHAWSSCFAPWNAGATVFVHNTSSFSVTKTIAALNRFAVNSLCAPPTAWRLFILSNLGSRPHALKELVSAGEPLNPQVINQIERSWGLTIRDGYGQTESTAQIGNTPGSKIKPGSMGRVLPGYRICLLDKKKTRTNEGEITLSLDPHPGGLMAGYLGGNCRTKKDGHYQTGDEAWVDDEGYYYFLGRGDDIFKSSDYRISPFELESALLEHELVAEAAIVPALDNIRLFIPKAFVTLLPGIRPDNATARRILSETNARLPFYKRIKRIEFAELPKTISGKIRRVELRKLEQEGHAAGAKNNQEFYSDEY